MSQTQTRTELIRDRVFKTRSQLELAIVEYVAWFNHLCRRRHKAFYAEVRVMPMWGRDRRLRLTIGAWRSA